MYGKDLKLKDVLSYVKTHKFVAENCHIKKTQQTFLGKARRWRFFLKTLPRNHAVW